MVNSCVLQKLQRTESSTSVVAERHPSLFYIELIQQRNNDPRAQFIVGDALEQAVESMARLVKVAADCDKAFQAFFREYGNGFRMAGRRLKVSDVGRIVVRWHRAIGGFVPCDIKTLRITHKAGRWYACFSVEMPEPSELPKTGQQVGLDVGVSAWVTTSAGEKVENPSYYRESQMKRRILQRSLARKKQGGKNRRKALLLELLVRVQRQQEHLGEWVRTFGSAYFQTISDVQG